MDMIKLHRGVNSQYDADVPLLGEVDSSQEEDYNIGNYPPECAVVDDPIILKRQLGLASCISMIVGTVIGSGIFISPKGILHQVPNVNLSLIIWVICGVVNMFGALSYGELGVTFSKSGGDYIYLLESFGPLVAFLRVWISLVAVRTGSMMVVLFTASAYVIQPFLSLYQEIPDSAVRLITALLMFAIFYINCVSVKWTSRLQEVLTVAKLLGLIIIIVSGLILLFKGHTEHFQEGFGVNIKYSNLPLAFYSGMYAFSGWQNLPQLTEEINDPHRTIPLSVIISMVLITTLYLLVNIAYYTVLSPQDILNSEAVALSYWQSEFGTMLWIMAVFVALSCIGSANGGLFGSSRMFFVASREGHLPSICAMINVHNKTPVPATLVMVPFCLLCLTSNSIYSLINYLSFTKWLFIGLTVATVPYNRWKHPEWKRPFKVPLFIPIFFVIFCLFLVSMSLYSAPLECGIGLVLMLSGIPLYFLGIKWKKKPTTANSTITSWLQQLLLVVQQEACTY